MNNRTKCQNLANLNFWHTFSTKI